MRGPIDKALGWVSSQRQQKALLRQIVRGAKPAILHLPFSHVLNMSLGSVENLAAMPRLAG